MDHFLEVFFEFATISLLFCVLVSGQEACGGLSFRTRDRTYILCTERRNLNHWSPKEVPHLLFCPWGWMQPAPPISQPPPRCHESRNDAQEASGHLTTQEKGLRNQWFWSALIPATTFFQVLITQESAIFVPCSSRHPIWNRAKKSQLPS